MGSPDKNWHKLHTKSIRKREATHAERLLRRRLGLRLEQQKDAMRVHMQVPIKMDITQNYEETVLFINEIKENIFKNNFFLFLNFSKCEHISSETCVVLASEIDRCLQIFPNSIQGNYPMSALVYFMLNELGFFQLLGIRSSRPIFDNNPEIDIVRLASGKDDDPVALKRNMKELFCGLASEKTGTPYAKDVSRALSEAMINSLEHAYREPFKSKNKNTCLSTWWRAGFKHNIKNTVVMVFYDQGAGMPNTLDITWREKIENFKTKFLRDPSDKEKIALAMEQGRTRTRVSGRGQGSHDIQKLIRESTDATLEIFSYHGKYMYRNTSQWSGDDATTPLQGTLIVWKICLDKKDCKPT